MGTQTPPHGQEGKPSGGEAEPVKDVELLRVQIVREGKHVNAEWAIHPQLKHDLRPEEWKEVAELMSKVTGIVGTCFTKVLAEAEPDKGGNA